jgi:hypothetical protein
MAVSDRLRRLRAAAPVPVHVAEGLGGGWAVSALRASPQVRLVPTPRHATLLVVTGAVPREHIDALAGVHDQVPSPRGVACMALDGDPAELGLGPVRRLADDDPVSGLRDLLERVVAGDGAPALGAADNPVDWQGVGPHGQGGEGMMGGTPYGRMMPMPPTEGRDGLALDRLALRLGPFLPGLPAGLVVDVGLQGDVLEEVDLLPAPSDTPVVGRPVPDPRPCPAAAPWLDALAELCAVAGLEALACRVARVALDPTVATVTDLRRRLDRRWGLRVATDGVGRLADGSDVTDRWRGWLDHAAAALDGAEAAPPPARTHDEVADGLVGAELGRAWLTLASLRPDLEPTWSPAGVRP